MLHTVSQGNPFGPCHRVMVEIIASKDYLKGCCQATVRPQYTVVGLVRFSEYQIIPTDRGTPDILSGRGALLQVREIGVQETANVLFETADAWRM